MSLLEFLYGSAVLLLVASAPGAALLAASRIAERLPGVLVLPAAFVATVVVALPATALRLWLERPIEWLAAWLALVAVVCTVIAGRRLGWRTGALLVVGRRVVAGLEDARLAPRPLPPRWLLGVLGAILLGALLIGSAINNDTIYHVAQSLKLERLAAPTFDNTLQFPDGGAHPGYLVPVWHDLLAVVSWVSGLHPVQVYWLSPGVIVGTYVLAWASVGAVAFGARRGAAIGAASYLVVEVVGTAAPIIPFEWAGQPRTWALDIGIPVVIASLLLTLWSSDRAGRRAALVLCAMAVAAVSFVHVSYLVFVGLGIAGYLVVATIACVRSRREALRRHALVAGVLLAVAVASVAVIVPRLHQLETFTSSGEAARATAGGRIDAPRNARIGVLFVGDEDSYRLRPDRLVPQGGIGLAALLLGAGALVLLPRNPLAWYASGAALAAFIVANSTLLFPIFTDAISPAQAQRLGLAVPLSILLMLSIEVIARALSSLRRPADSERRAVDAQAAGAGSAVSRGSILVVAGTLGAIAVASLATIAWPRRSAVYEAAPTTLVLAVEALFAVSALALLVRLARSPGDIDFGGAATDTTAATTARNSGAGETGTSIGMDGRVAALVTACLVVALLPMAGRVVTTVRTDMETPPRGVRIDWLGDYPTAIIDKLLTLGEEDVLLAEPGLAYRMMAVAPFYVVASEPGHTADVPANRIVRRHNTIERFFDEGTRNSERDRILTEFGVTWVLLDEASTPREVLSWARSSPHVGAARTKADGLLLYDTCTKACPSY